MLLLLPLLVLPFPCPAGNRFLARFEDYPEDPVGEDMWDFLQSFDVSVKPLLHIQLTLQSESVWFSPSWLTSVSNCLTYLLVSHDTASYVCSQSSLSRLMPMLCFVQGLALDSSLQVLRLAVTVTALMQALWNLEFLLWVELSFSTEGIAYRKVLLLVDMVGAGDELRWYCRVLASHRTPQHLTEKPTVLGIVQVWLILNIFQTKHHFHKMGT